MWLIRISKSPARRIRVKTFTWTGGKSRKTRAPRRRWAIRSALWTRPRGRSWWPSSCASGRRTWKSSPGRWRTRGRPQTGSGKIRRSWESGNPFTSRVRLFSAPLPRLSQRIPEVSFLWFTSSNDYFETCPLNRKLTRLRLLLGLVSQIYWLGAFDSQTALLNGSDHIIRLPDGSFRWVGSIGSTHSVPERFYSISQIYCSANLASNGSS